jgi:hypothetical protein
VRPEEPIGPDPTHEAGKHIEELEAGCWQCQRLRPDIERTAEQVRYITGGIQLPADWRTADPPRTDADDEAIELWLEAERFELEPDYEDAWGWDE